MSFIFISAAKRETGQLDFAYLETDDSLKILNGEGKVLSFEEHSDEIRDILTNPDIGIITWEGYEDYRLLLDEFKKIDVEPFDFQLFDVEYMLNVIENDDDTYNIESFVPLSLQKKETHPYPLNRCYFILYALRNMLYSIGDNFETFLNRKDFESCFYYSLDAYFGTNPKDVYNPQEIAKELIEKETDHYVFFDFECANCFDKIGKICEIGAVITDTSFNIIKEIHHPINPNSEFHLLSKDNIHGLHLFWEANNYAAYRKAPSLKYFYDEFKTLLTDPRAIYVGHSVDNDISFLYTDLERNNLDEFCVHAIDTQKMYRKLFDETDRKSISLENAVVALLGEEELTKYTPHKSLDDAKMTLAVFKAILDQSGMTVTDILTRYPTCVRSTEEIDLTSRLKGSKYVFPLPYNTDYITLASPNDLFCGFKTFGLSERIYLEACCEDYEKSKIRSFKGKRYAFQRFIKRYEPEIVEDLIAKIRESGGILVSKTYYADVVIFEKPGDVQFYRRKKSITVYDLRNGTF